MGGTVCDRCRVVVDTRLTYFKREGKKRALDYCSTKCMVDDAPTGWNGNFTAVVSPDFDMVQFEAAVASLKQEE